MTNDHAPPLMANALKIYFFHSFLNMDHLVARKGGAAQLWKPVPAPSWPRQRPTLEVQPASTNIIEVENIKVDNIMEEPPPSTNCCSGETRRKTNRRVVQHFTNSRFCPGTLISCKNAISQKWVYLGSKRCWRKKENHRRIIPGRAVGWIAVDGLQQ